MFKSILAPLGGGESDSVVLDTALTVARIAAAHIDCFHSYVDSAEAAAASHQVPYLIGGALTQALDRLDTQGRQRAANAQHHYADFCRLYSLGEAPGRGVVSASMKRDCGSADDNLIFQARHHDLAVMARPRSGDNLPPDTLSRMLVEGGQPILLVPTFSSAALLGTVALCWKDTASSARALTAALPLLSAAKRVLLFSLNEGRGTPAASIEAAIAHLARHGIPAKAVTEPAGGAPVALALMRWAMAQHVDLLVMGSHSQRPLRELLLGSCTQSVLAGGDLPVLLVH
ncbi:MAG TPA: universal stress protein [Nevskia sp.]|nr:universal stress protein [Nevskia sp.]